MLKRVPLTALALGMMWAGLAQAQLFIEEGTPRPAAPTLPQAPMTPAPVTPAPVTSASVTPSVRPTSGLVIVDGYDQPVAPPTVVAQAPRPVSGGVSEVGTRPAKVASVEGWADAVPLSVALAQIVPHEFKVDSTGLDAGSRSVSWSGNQRPWPVVLEGLAKAQRLAIVIRWADRQVVVRAADQAATVSLATAVPPANQPANQPVVPAVIEKEKTTVTTTRTTTVVDAKPAVAATSHPVVVEARPVDVRPVAAAPQSWRLDPTKTLKVNVEDWARQAGWNRVVWEGADYPIAAPAVFSGRFDAPDGPLAQLIAGFADSDQPLLVKLTLQDRVVHIVNKNYTPAQVESVSPQEMAPATFDLSGNGNKSQRAEAAEDAAEDARNIQAGSQMAPLRIDDRSTHAVRH